MKLTVLGCLTPLPRRDAPCSGYLISNERTTVLLDCGFGVFPALADRIDPRKLSAVWISHMHPDHCADLIALANWALNTDDAPKIRVLGPPGWDTRLNGFISEDSSRDLVREVFHVEHLADGSVSSVGEFKLTSRFVHHSVPTYGVRITDKDSVFAYSGDSGPCQALEQLASEADVFLCEAGSREPVEHHMTAQQTYELATSARVGRLLVTHTPDPARSDEVVKDGGRFVEFVSPRDEWVVGPRGA